MFMRVGLMVLGLLWMVVSFAAPPSTEDEAQFNLKAANQQFDRINLQLSVQNLNLSTLNQAVGILSKLTLQADQCVYDSQKKLKNLETLIQQTTKAEDEIKTGADLVYLNNEQKKLATHQSKCRLFSIRAKEAINAYQVAIANLKQAQTFAHGTPLWDILAKLYNAPFDAHINTHTFIALLEEISWQSAFASLPTWMTSIVFWLAAFAANLILGAGLLFLIKNNRLAKKYLRMKAIFFRHVAVIGVALFAGEVFLFFNLHLSDLKPFILLSKLIFIYSTSLVALIFIFKIKKIRAFFYWYALNQDFFKYLSFVGLTLLACSYFVKLLVETSIVSTLISQLAQSILLLSLLMIASYFIVYFCKTHRHFQLIKHYRHIIKFFTLTFLGLCALLDIVGYHTLAKRLTVSSVISFIIILIAVFLNQGVKKSYFLISHSSPLNQRIIQLFGYKPEDNYTEFYILKFTLQLMLFTTAIFYMIKSWAFADYYLVAFTSFLIHGLHLGSFTFYPIRVLAGVILFCVLYLLFRGISTAISRQQQFENEEETQVAIASILTYIGFAIALIASLLVAGFDFTGLAIVAGALSVGIGLGLQSIVNNFVSGLILLIEKPIKPGDRIMVDNVEGIVKKIRVRSTQITTAAREDIIVPNSDLITRRVTNYMYTDRHLAISCQIGVAYGSDIQQVQELLLKAATQHDEVIKTGRNKPNVLFKAFGDNNLEFQLWCLIKDANKKGMVQSDLNFAIERLFREHEIQMAYPQREIHLRLSDLGPVLDKTKTNM